MTSSAVDICEVIASELEKIGIKMNVKVLPCRRGPRRPSAEDSSNMFTRGVGNPDPGGQPGTSLGARMDNRVEAIRQLRHRSRSTS